MSSCRRPWNSAAALIPGLVLGLLLALHAAPCAAGTIVPQADWMSDTQTRLLLADLQFAQGRMAEAARTYQQALDAGADQGLVLPSLVRALVWSGEVDQAMPLLDSLLADAPDDAHLLLLAAQASLQAGRFQRAGDLARRLRRVLSSGPGVASTSANLADPADLADLADIADIADVETGLGHALAARDLYQEALALDGSPGMQLRAAEAGLLRGDFTRALQVYQRALADAPPDSSDDRSLRLKLGKVLLASQRLAEAEEVCRLLLLDQPGDPEAQALLQRVLAEDGRAPESASPEAASAIPWESGSPPDLLRRAQAMAASGDYPAALALLDQALLADPEYFPASMARAEYLAYSGAHEQALAELQALLDQFPDSRKLLLTRARVLAWAERYQESLEAYARLHAADPGDPVPLREAARTAFWGKMRDQGLALYARLWESPVDKTVAGVPDSDPDVPWDGYEALAASGSADQRTLLQGLAEYRIQKEAWLESQAKDLAWNKRFGPAMDTLARLSGFAPGNQEALFDLAQAACALGLCHEEHDAYLQLLELDPLHTLAGDALARMEDRNQPTLRAEASFWQERGRGELAKMVRFQQAALFDLPLDCAWTLTLGQKYWLERPLEHSDSFPAWGHVLGLSGVLSDIWRIDGQWTRKYYREHGLGDYDLGRVRLGANLDGVAVLGLGYERLEELGNIHALRQKTRSDNLFLDYLVNITREVALSGEGRMKYFDDGNQSWRTSLELGWAVTDHPRMLKLSLLGEYRDTKEASLSTGGSDDKAVEHPYWTPQDYVAGALALEWRHDLSEDYYCGALNNSYQLRLALGTDNDDNPSIQLEGSWDYDLDEHWSLDLKGLWHRSEAWDANGVWTGLEYHF